MVRVLFIVKGNVQGVGYRSFVKQVANALGVKGMVRNQDDGSVEVYAESSKETLEGLKKRITLKGKIDDVFSSRVESIQEFSENDGSFNPPKNAFQRFSIDYGETLSKWQREMVERNEIGGLMLQRLEKTTESGFRELNQTTSQSDQTMASFREQTSNSFSTMESKYGTVSDILKEISQDLKELNKSIQKVVEKIVKA